MSFEKDMEQRVVQIEEIIAAYLPKEEGFQKTVLSAMNYSVQAGGKRLRPLFMQEAFQIFCTAHKTVWEEKELEALHAFMAAIEMIHTYSLVHDDLPAMDNDEFRRGRKTTHIVYGEAMAILAGDALLNYAFETAASSFQKTEDAARVGRALQILAEKAGIYGMVGGQVADVEAEEKQLALTEEQLLFIYEKKTSALIQSALMIGAVLGHATDDEIKCIEKIGYDIGIAFQIQDDILDVTSTLEELGKPIGSDDRNHKTTYVTLKGLEHAKEEVRRISVHALTLLEQLPGDTAFLKELILSLIDRKK